VYVPRPTTNTIAMTDGGTNQDLKEQLRRGDPAFWDGLAARSADASRFDQLLFLSSLRKKAVARGLARPGTPAGTVRLALLGGYSTYPLSDLLEHLLVVAGLDVELLLGDYDNYTAEMLEDHSRLYGFRPDVVCLLPSLRACQPSGRLTDPRDALEAEAVGVAQQLLGLCRAVHERARCEVALANFPLPAGHDPGPYRVRSLASDWSFRKRVNLELGLAAPSFVHVCDAEFLTNRRGAVAVRDDRGWYESKQPGSPDFVMDLAREFARLVLALRRPPRKVLVLDLDNTLWGGVVADDGLEGIELGDTSPRGEAFKAFQAYVKSLQERGTLLAVCSKNDHATAVEPFEQHPEMVLHLSDFAAFAASWDPKSDSIRRMAAELNLGLDSFVFVDDNAAEVDIVRRFAPEVAAIHLGPDPADYVALLQDCRLFEPLTITADDARRTAQYHTERQRQALLTSATDMNAYLASLEMEALVADFNPLDAPRIAQLINKSNQFNLTTRRRTEAEVLALIPDPAYTGFSVRLRDRFGDHGLIGVAVGHVAGPTMTVDTWLMSCRVLKRQVEDEVLNELARRAREQGCTTLRGVYLPTAKNGLVRDHYPSLGFAPAALTAERAEYALELASFEPRPTHIRVTRDVHEPV
jgi:FkbH-like protein